MSTQHRNLAFTVLALVAVAIIIALVIPKRVDRLQFLTPNPPISRAYALGTNILYFRNERPMTSQGLGKLLAWVNNSATYRLFRKRAFFAIGEISASPQAPSLYVYVVFKQNSGRPSTEACRAFLVDTAGIRIEGIDLSGPLGYKLYAFPKPPGSVEGYYVEFTEFGSHAFARLKLD